MAALSPADIAVPIRSVLADRNVRIIRAQALHVDVDTRQLHCDVGSFDYDYLSGFRNRVSVFVQWAWSYVTLERGARLIVGKEWRAYPEAANRGS